MYKMLFSTTTDYHSDWFEWTPTQICNKIYYNKFWSQAYHESQTNVSVIKIFISYIPGNVSMNYEVHDWQIFPEERTQTPGRMCSPLLCVCGYH